MRSIDRTIVVGLAVVGLVAGLWFGLIKPKREEISKLDSEISALEDDVAAQEALAVAAEQAKEDYDTNYHRLVVLGKAVPGEADSASLLVETNSLAGSAKIDFRSLTLSDAGTAESAAPAEQTTADPPAEGQVAAPEQNAAPAPPTEAAAAALPIGATVGPGGLPVMPYDLSFRGEFFEIADFFASLDSLVDVEASGPGVDGRLITVDGFSLTADPDKGFPHLSADLHVTTFVTPADQGLTAGATPAAPAEPVPATPTASAPAEPAAETTTDPVPVGSP